MKAFKHLLKWLKRLFNSQCLYFFQSEEILREERKLLDLYLQCKKYDIDQRAIYLRAFDYFCMFPWEYDGATMTEDLCDLEGLDLDAMLHDWLYIAFSASGNYKYIWKADKLMRKEMRRKGKSTINGGLRFVLLCLKTLIGYPAYSYLFKGRHMTAHDKEEVSNIYKTLSKKPVRSWYKEYAGEMQWTAAIILVAAGYVWRVGFNEILKSIIWFL